MNQSILMGRLTRDPDIRYSQGKDPLAIANFRLAVDRPYRRNDDEETADYFSCTAFGRLAEFAEKHLVQGIKIIVTGRLQNDNYKNRDGDRVYGTRIILSQIEFAESKKTNESYRDGGGEERRGNSSGDRRSARNSDRDYDRDSDRDSDRDYDRNGRRSGNDRRDSRSDERRSSRSDSNRRSQNYRDRDPDEEFRDVEDADTYAFQ